MSIRRKNLWKNPAMGYVLAVVAVAVTTPVLSALQKELILESGGYIRPYSVLYLLSIALIAAIWGGRQAFVALGLSVLATKLFLMPPNHSLLFENTRDVIEIISLFLSGAIITLTLDRLQTAYGEGRILLEKVTAQQRELQAVLDSMTDAIIIADVSGKILAMNPAALSLYGYESFADAPKSSQEFPNLFDVHFPDWRPVPLEDWPFARVLRGEKFSHYELHARRRDTGKFWVGSYAGTTVLDQKGKPNQVVLMIRDITERQYMEQALRISEERLRFAVEGAEIGIWQWDIYTNEMRFSNRCRLIFGIEPDSELGYDAFIERLHPEDRERTCAAMADAIGDKTECHLEFRVRRPDGGLHWIASRASGFYDVEGIPLRMEGIASEIVERRRPEGELPSLEAPDLPERRPPPNILLRPETSSAGPEQAGAA